MITSIDNNIPVPVEEEKNEWRKPLDNLEPGASFSFENKFRNSVANSVSAHFHKLTNKVFKIGKDPVFPETHSRVWRRLKDKEQIAKN